MTYWRAYLQLQTASRMSGVTGSARGNVGPSPEDPKLAKLEEEEEEEEETAGVVAEAEMQAGTDRPAIVRAATLEEDTLEARNGGLVRR